VSRSKIFKGELDKIGKDAVVDSYVGPKKTTYPKPKLEPGAFRIDQPGYRLNEAAQSKPLDNCLFSANSPAEISFLCVGLDKSTI
jgi:hypothetical protein